MTSPYVFQISSVVAALTIVLWAWGRLPEYQVALLFFTLVPILRLAPADVVFAGFESAAFWMVLSGFVIGAAIRKVGLADRIAAHLAERLAGTWLRLLAGVTLSTVILAVFMPSNQGRIALLMPIMLALADRAGFPAGSRARAAIALAVGFGTFELSAAILPANVPNLILSGAAERAYGLRLDYLEYLLALAPVLTLAKGGILVACLYGLFPARVSAGVPSGAPTAFSREEVRLVCMLGVCLLFWATDRWHGIAPAWIGMAAACFCVLPGVGFLSGEEFAVAINVRTCLYVAAILGLSAFVMHAGIDRALVDHLLPVLPIAPDRPFTSFLSMTGLASAMGFAVTVNGVPALYTPMAETLAQASGQSLRFALYAQVLAYATPLLPFQASPIVVAMAMAGVPARDGVRLCVCLAALTLIILLPLQYMWLRLLE